MPCLDFDKLDALDAAAFQHADPFPWINPEGLLRADAFDDLRRSLPDVAGFDPYFGIKRSHGQQSHDRWVKEYHRGMDVAPVWQEFIDELLGDRYAAFIRRMYGEDFTSLTLHWHYTPNGCSVSPHCDASHKLGSHIFYFNTEDDWRPEWGGETLVLDDGGRFKRGSAPDFDDFDRVISSTTLGNRSLLFRRRGDSWHGVKPIRCPEGAYRKVLIVVVNSRVPGPLRRTWDRLRGKPARDY
jgi:hypothetical protein